MPSKTKEVKESKKDLKKRKIEEISKDEKGVNVNDIVIPDYTDEEDDSEEDDDDSDDSDDNDDSDDSDDKDSDDDDDEEEENSDDDNDDQDSDSNSKTIPKPDTKPELPTDDSEKKKVDPKFAEFYKRFQNAARNIALAAYNVDEERDEFGNVRAVKALPQDAAEDAEADKEVRQVMQRREAAVIPQGLVPLPVPDVEISDDENEYNADYDVMDESGVPDLAQLRKKINKPTDSLPPWLAHPIHVASSVTIPFDHIEGLLPNIKDGVKKGLGYHDAFAVQATLLPPLLAATLDISPDPRPDILVNAATGSGKTLAYAIPIVQDLSRRVVPKLRAVVLLPTRPLITQVVHVFRTLAASASTKLHITSLHGDHTLRSEQERLQNTIPDIIVSTPGRLVDHLRLGTISLNHLQYLVVDEADRLLSDSFNEWASIVTQEIDREKDVNPKQVGSKREGSGLLKNLRFKKWSRPTQKLIFSATLTRDPGKLALLRIRDPQVYIIGGGEGASTTLVETENSDGKRSKQISGTPSSADGKEFAVPRTLLEVLVPIKSISVKPLRLMQLIASHQGHTKGIEDNSMKSHVLVFVNSNESAARLARLLTLLDEEVFHLGLVYERCSSEQPTHVRRRVLRAFAATGAGVSSNNNGNSNQHEGPINVLVCTDIVARGIDIAAVRNVINYDIPRGPREYVHRVGRTARAGQSGTAWSFAADRHDHGRFWRGISVHILREGKTDNQEPIPKSKEGETGEKEEADERDVSNDAVQKYDLEDQVPKEDTRDYERVEEGYNRALQRLEKEVYGK